MKIVHFGTAIWAAMGVGSKEKPRVKGYFNRISAAATPLKKLNV
ncbi:MAG TPA: hypothetical protein VFE46_19835 [Pirellulales bacterium]|jgi:hypothetical protein|nr:hypothetical protein [Pirellulales bacterium]